MGAKHVKTDPKCLYYRTPTTPWSKWRHDRARGKPCPVCVPRTALPPDFWERFDKAMQTLD